MGIQLLRALLRNCHYDCSIRVNENVPDVFVIVYFCDVVRRFAERCEFVLSLRVVIGLQFDSDVVKSLSHAARPPQQWSNINQTQFCS